MCVLLLVLRVGMELEEREVTVRVYSNIAMGKDDLIYGVSGDIFYSIIKIGRASR